MDDVEQGKFIEGRREWRCRVFGHRWKKDDMRYGPESDDSCARCGARWETFHGDCPSGECGLCDSMWEARVAKVR